MKFVRYCNLFCYYECFVILVFIVVIFFDDMVLVIENILLDFFSNLINNN